MPFFLLPTMHGAKRLGMSIKEYFSKVEHKRHYLNLALAMAPVLALVISNVRNFQAKERLIFELQEALSRVKTLSGLLPICANCKKIRDDRGYWNRIEAYIGEHADVQFSHGICPECARKLYPELFQEKKAGEAISPGE